MVFRLFQCRSGKKKFITLNVISRAGQPYLRSTHIAFFSVVVLQNINAITSAVCPSYMWALVEV